MSNQIKAILSKAKQYQENAISENSKATYSSCLKLYEESMSK